MGIVEAANAGLLVQYIDSHTSPSHLSPPISSSKRSSRPKKPRESRKERKERLALLATQPVPTLFQRNPFKTNTSFYMPHSYTQNIESFCNQARKRRSAIFRNLRMTGRYVSHLVTINLYDPHHPALINPVFRAFAKELGKHNLDGHWTIEINTKNLLHWHLLFLDSPHTPTHLKSLVRQLLDKVKFPRSRVEVERTQDQNQLIDYVLKVLKPGYQTYEKEPDALGCRTSSISVSDLYATKRVLFVKGTGLDKHGTFGNFWAKGWSQKKFWEQIKQERKQIEENMKDPKVRELVEHMHKTMGFALTTAKWAFALNPYPTRTVVAEQANQKTSGKREPKKPVRTRRRFRTLYRGMTKPNRATRPLNAPGAQWAIPKPMRPSGSRGITVTHYGTDVRIPRSRPP